MVNISSRTYTGLNTFQNSETTKLWLKKKTFPLMKSENFWDFCYDQRNLKKYYLKKKSQKKTQETLDCNCTVKTGCPLSSDCRKESVIYNVQQQPVSQKKSRLFQNIFSFCTFLPKFLKCLPFINTFLHFFWKMAHILLLSRIDPESISWIDWGRV